ALALAYALIGGLVARRLGLPTIVGYLLAGVALGPFTPGLTGDTESIQQLAELGVILLMFGIGLHFTLSDLWEVRDIAIPGAVLQMAIATAAGYWMALAWGWSPASALVLGVAISVASTVVLLRGLMDIGALDTTHGRVAVGWLILEDLATVAILVLLPALMGPGRAAGWYVPALAIGKALLFIGLMLVIGKRVIPAILGAIADTQSRELFVLVALTAALGTALASAYLFGVSLALGAFVAGVVVSESPLSHQVGADLLPFREAFAVLFFVSVGMLVNPGYLLANWQQVLALTALVVVGKSALAAILGFAFPYPARTALIVGAGLSQIGEFSFIVGQAGVGLGVLDETQYSLILAGAIVSITLNPWMFRLIDPIEKALRARPRLWDRLDRHGPLTPRAAEGLEGHIVIVGCGRVGGHIAEVAGKIGAPYLVVESDASRVKRLQEQGARVLFGDAANSEILGITALDRARALVVTVPDDSAAIMVVRAARRRVPSPSLHIVARASTWEGARHLKDAGATDVVRPELEGGLEILRRTLLGLEYPAQEIQRYTDAVRSEGLESLPPRDDRAHVLDDLAHAMGGLEVSWFTISDQSAVAGRTLSDSNLRLRTGAFIVAINRDDGVVSNPGPLERLAPGDRVAVIGSPTEVEDAGRLLSGSGSAVEPVEP
ncbi:MAG TPA: cation:proton antiporter, partial [Vicinamibacteria bacterium]|nr:cation:proton antiporter [Vicinamibacteria bacterium]